MTMGRPPGLGFDHVDSKDFRRYPNQGGIKRQGNRCPANVYTRFESGQIDMDAEVIAVQQAIENIDRSLDVDLNYRRRDTEKIRRVFAFQQNIDKFARHHHFFDLDFSRNNAFGEKNFDAVFQRYSDLFFY